MFPGDNTFELFAPSIFRIEAACDGDIFAGTGFVVGVFQTTRRLVLATAKHVIDFPNDKIVEWTVQQFDRIGNPTREVKFQSTCKAATYTHKHVDVGLLKLTNQSSTEGETPPVQIDIDSGVTTGTRIAWAGYPGIVRNALGFPQLCYFEGAISAMVDSHNRQLYIVDGHAAQGVSGGPVWHWSEERKRAEIVGIVSEYRALNNGLPGFCFFEPINPIIAFLGSKHWQSENDVLIINHLDGTEQT